MLSGIKLVSKEEAERLDAEERKHQKKEHKRKHKKKHKKEKRDRREYNDSGDSDSEPEPHHRARTKEKPDEDHKEGDDAPSEPAHPAAQREDWMTVPMARSLDPGATIPDNQEAPSDPVRPKISTKELNPELRAGGDGAPGDAATIAPAAGVGIGDGGASWRMKALRRAQNQGGEEGRGLNDIVAERWGSLGDLTAELTERQVAHDMAHTRAARDRRGHERREGGREREGGGGGRKYLSDVRSAKSQMRRPSEVDLEKMSWRRGAGSRSDKSESEGGRGGSREGGRDYRESHRERDPTRFGGSRQGRGSDAEATLKAAAPALNAFANDGSFLDQFQEGGGGAGSDQEKEGAEGRVKSSLDGGGEREAQEPQERPRSDDRDPRYDNEEMQYDRRDHQRSRHDRRDGVTKKEDPRQANLSAAAMLRARLGGRPPTAPTPHHREETVVLPLIDAVGRAAPGAFGREAAGAVAGAVRPTKRLERFKGGERKRYFADDDAMDLDTLVKRTKYGSTEDIDATMARNIARKTNFKETDLDPDAEYDVDGGLDLADGQRKASKDARRRGSASEEVAQREKQRQVREYTRFQSALDRCSLCFTSKSRPKHLTLAIGTAAYLALPPRGRLVPGHCQIIPVEHVGSTRVADEATWTEIRNFKKCVLQMFMSQGMDCIFLETAARPAGDVRAHAIVDCVPVPQDVFSKAPMYFRKAVDDATSEWSQHASKRMIDTSSKGLRGAIPPNFPYFFVEFGLAAGFVHVIDNPEEFDRDLGRGVLIGLLGLPEEDMHRRAKSESQVLQTQWAAEFRSQFDEFDWTKQL